MALTVIPPRPVPRPITAPRPATPERFDRAVELGLGLPLVGVMYVIVGIVWVAEHLLRRRSAIRP